MKKELFLLLFIVFQSFFICCNPEEIFEIDVLPQLELQISDRSNNVVQGATVMLFSSEENWESQSSAIKVSSSDLDGKALFKDLNETQYYFYIEKGDLNNYYEAVTFSEPLRKNEKRTINCIIR